jgi:periodic tryptophan protein 1
MLPSFPLCLEWLDYKPYSATDSGYSGNYIAVGTFDPDIEIWSLDVVDAMYPDAVLGRPDKTKAHVPTPAGTGKKKKKKMKARETSSDHHVDAVLGLSWNRSHRNLLASASADKTVKLWDLSRELSAPAVRSFEVHQDKVQSVQWNREQSTVLLTGSYDRTVRMFDSRSPDGGVGVTVGSDVEVLKWDPWDSHSFYVSLARAFCVLD